MVIKKDIANIEAFEAGDKTILREVIHPKNDAIELPYSLAHAYLELGEASLPHVLSKSEETYYFLEGEGRLFIEEEEVMVKKGSVVMVPKGARQYLKNTGKKRLIFICIVSPPWTASEEEVYEGA